jgi:hypothetical protein
MLVSCTVAEPAAGEAAWNAATAYTVGQEVIRATTHRRYKRIAAGTTATEPENDTTNWLDVGATNRWSQFDSKIGTKTTGATSVTTVIKPGSCEGLALLDLVGTSVDVTVRETTGGAVAYTKHIDLDASIVTSVYDWMYGEYTQRLNVVLTDLPGQYPSGEITVTVNSTSGAAIGVLAAGRVHALGVTEYGAGAGIINWGKVSDDGFGNREWLEGEWANRVTLPIIANRSDMARLHRQLAKVRSTPCIYIGCSLAEFEPLVCYGVYRDLYITVPYYSVVQMNLEIDGLNNV